MSLYLAVFGKPRYLGLVDIGDKEIEEQGLCAGRWVVIETLRGTEMALLGGTLSLEQEGKYRSACLDESSDEHTKGPEPMLQEVTLVGAASDSQLEECGTRRKDEEAVLVRSRQILRGHEFQMKLVDVEYTLDRKKLFFYFTSEQRVDFRAYVRDLAKEFRIRIEMRQIGVRDEAKTVRGVSPCGRPCCCSYWLHRFTPINIRMVKEQNLALNPTKISGICGRLMCCMFYEHSTYSELWKTLPSPGSKIKTPQGNYVMEGVDLRAETVRVGLPEGGTAAVPVAEFADFKETVLRGEHWRKDEEKDAKEQESKPLVTRAGTSGIAPRPPREREKAHEPPDDSIKNNRRSKPEKISIEEHIAERVNVSYTKEEIDSGNRRRRRKDAPPVSRKQEVQQARPSQVTRERRPEDRRADTEQRQKRPAPAHKSPINAEPDNKRRPRKDGGHERSGAPNKGDA